MLRMHLPAVSLRATPADEAEFFKFIWFQLIGDGTLPHCPKLQRLHLHHFLEDSHKLDIIWC